MTHSHILFTVIWKDGNILLNDALNTCYLRLYGIIYMVEDHSDRERGNLLLSKSATLSDYELLYASSHRQDTRDGASKRSFAAN